VEPITLTFAACKLAYEGIKTAVEVYKDVKRTGGEVTGIAGEVGGLLSKFFYGQDQIEEAHKQKLEETRELASQGKVKNVTIQAIDNVMHLRQVRQYYKDLEHMVRYELGMPDLWVEIKAERERLIAEALEVEMLHKQAIQQAELKRQEKIRRIKQKIHIYVTGLIAAVYVCISIWFLIWLVEYDRKWRWGY
jgi:hypothetical protein